MAQSVARAFLSPCVRRAWSSLLSALGHSEAFRDYLVYRRGSCSRPFVSDTRLCRRGGWTLEPRVGDSAGFTDQLLVGFRRVGPGARSNRDCRGAPAETFLCL